MTKEEETGFHEAVKTVNQAIMTGQCSFESDLDRDAQVYFRYTLRDNAQNPLADPRWCRQKQGFDGNLTLQATRQGGGLMTAAHRRHDMTDAV